MTNYNDMKQKIEYRQEFNGNSVTAKYDNKGNYVVSSYNTDIYSSYGTVQNFFDNTYYSTTTSKIQNILIEVFDLNNGVKKRS